MVLTCSRHCPSRTPAPSCTFSAAAGLVAGPAGGVGPADLLREGPSTFAHTASLQHRVLSDLLLRMFFQPLTPEVGATAVVWVFLKNILSLRKVLRFIWVAAGVKPRRRLLHRRGLARRLCRAAHLVRSLWAGGQLCLPSPGIVSMLGVFSVMDY